MFPCALMHASQVHTVVRVLLVLLAGAVFSCSVVIVWLAATNPIELEVREGSVWLHVLAARAGVDIYDPMQVAFVNMNHGPLDPILKTWLSRCFPSLSGPWVTRAFVVLTPLVFLGSAYGILRKKLASALLAAGALHLLFVHTSLLALVGRPDATAVCFLAACGLPTHVLVENAHWRWFERRFVLWQIGLGVLACGVLLASWRYLPAAMAFQFVVTVQRLSRAKPTHLFALSSQRAAARFGFAVEQTVMTTLLFFAGFALLWVPVFLIELSGNFETYYKRFFGFFSAESGWGTFAGAKFEIFPESLLHNREVVLLAFSSLLLIAVFRLRRRRLELAAWLLMGTAMWFAVSYGFYKNQLGGGLHYYFEFYLFAWVFILHALGQPNRFGIDIKAGLCVAILVCMPWQTLFQHSQRALNERARARQFMHHVELVTQGEPIFGEGTHLFKDEYRGEVVDTGDAAHATATTRYFGLPFTYTYERYLYELEKSPPRFVLAAVFGEQPLYGIMTPTLRELLVRRYRRRLIIQGSAFTIGGSHALFELRSTGTRRRQTHH